MSAPAVQPATLHHIGIVVSDLEAAMAEMTALFGLGWTAPQLRPDRERTLRVAFSTSQPRIELIEGNEDGIWSTAGGPRIDHLAFWTPDIDDVRSRTEAVDAAEEVSGTAAWGGKWSYLRLAATGARVELCDEAGRERFRQQWGFDVA